MEITKACIVAFMKARISFVVWWKKKKKKQKIENMKFFKALAKYQKVAHGRPFITWTSWKGNDMLYYYVTLLKID